MQNKLKLLQFISNAPSTFLCSMSDAHSQMIHSFESILFKGLIKPVGKPVNRFANLFEWFVQFPAARAEGSHSDNIKRRRRGSLSSFHETSQRISPLWELLPSKLSWRPIGSRQSKWLANCREACKYELERQYKCGTHDNYVRIFFFTLLNLGYGLNYYSSRSRFAHSRAGLMAAPLQRSGEYDIS